VESAASEQCTLKEGKRSRRSKPVPDECQNKLDALLLRGPEVKALPQMLKDFGTATEAGNVPPLRKR
jgi:hypothetical protein